MIAKGEKWNVLNITVLSSVSGRSDNMDRYIVSVLTQVKEHIFKASSSPNLGLFIPAS